MPTPRTATKGTGAASATVTITLPTGTTTGDVIIVGFANAGTSGPSTPSGWALVRTTDSAGTGQSLTLFKAKYSAGLTLNFTNAATVCAWACQSLTGANINQIVDTSLASSNTGNNTTLPTGAPTTGTVAGDYELLFYAWTSAATISTPAAGSTIDGTQANGTAVSIAIGHNNTTSLGASTATTAFSQTLSANNTRKTGVGVLIVSPDPVTVTPPVSSLTTTKFVPVIGKGYVVPIKSLTTSRFASIIALGVIPPVRSLTTTKFVPVIGNGYVVPIKSLTTSRFASIIALGVIPPVQTLSCTSYTPGATATVNRLITPPVRSSITTCFAPTVTVYSPSSVSPASTTLWF